MFNKEIVLKRVAGSGSLREECFYRYSGSIQKLVEVDSSDLRKVSMVAVDGGSFIEEYSLHDGLLFIENRLFLYFNKKKSKELKSCIFIFNDSLFFDIGGEIFDVDKIQSIRLFQFMMFGFFRIKLKDGNLFYDCIFYPFWLNFFGDGRGEKYDSCPFFMILNLLKLSKNRSEIKAKLKEGYFFVADWIRPKIE